MTSKSTWMCARATPPGGIIATFIDSCFAPTFLPDIPSLYWMPFQSRHTPLARIHINPSCPSTFGGRPSSIFRAYYLRDAADPPHRHGRVLRIRGAARQARAARTARRRRRGSPPAVGGRRGQLRGAGLRRAIGHPYGARGAALPPPADRASGFPEVPGGLAEGLRDLPVGDPARRAAVTR